MEPTHEVLEISSDEDDDVGGRGGDWLSYLFENEKEDSDVVVVLGEMSDDSASQKQSNKLSLKEDLDEDDCLILDGDPANKPVEVENNSDNSDELLVVSEKGQCHCYVCDIRAPCIYWGTGVSRGDHCHSTEKEETWRVQRKFFRQGKTAQLPVLKHPDTTRSTVSNLPKSCPTFACSQPLNNGYTPPVMLSKSSTIRACSSYSNFGGSSIINPKYHQQPAQTQMVRPMHTELTPGRKPHHGVSRSSSFSPSSSIINNTIRKDKGTDGASLGPRVDSHGKFKRCGESILSNNRSGHVYDKNNVHISQPQRNHHTTVSLPEKNPHTTVSQQQRSHQITVSQPQRSHHTTSQSQRNNHLNLIYSCISDTRSADSFADINSGLTEYQSASQPILSSSYTDSPSYNMALQPQVHSQPIPQLSEKQNTYLPENPAPNVTNQNMTDYEMNWVNDIVQGVAPSAAISQLPIMQSPSGPPPVTEVNPQCPEATNLASADFDLDNWIQSFQPNLLSVQDTMSSELGFIHTQDGLVDEAAMLLFDFESS